MIKLRVNAMFPSAGSGTTDHSKLENLDYGNSGHTGFASSADISQLNENVFNLETNKADKTEIPDVSGFITEESLNNYALKNEVPTKTSQLTNDSKYQTLSQVNTLINDAIGSVLEGSY